MDKKINISNRLKTIGDLVYNNSNILDVGCDHGLLSIYIYQNKKKVTITISDINKKPLESAQNNLKLYNLDKKINCVLSDGLKEINNKFDTLIISGLGGNTICDILIKGKDKLENAKQIIIQSNNNKFKIRKLLTNFGYYIKEEKLVKENNIIYTIISFEKGKKHYTKKELFFGPILIKNKDELFYKLLDNKIKKYKKVYNNIPSKYFIKRFKTRKYLKLLQSVKN